MEHLLLVIRNVDEIFTVTFKQLGMEHFLLGVRFWDGTFTVVYKELGSKIYS